MRKLIFQNFFRKMFEIFLAKGNCEIEIFCRSPNLRCWFRISNKKFCPWTRDRPQRQPIGSLTFHAELECAIQFCSSLGTFASACWRGIAIDPDVIILQRKVYNLISYKSSSVGGITPSRTPNSDRKLCYISCLRRYFLTTFLKFSKISNFEIKLIW